MPNGSQTTESANREADDIVLDKKMIEALAAFRYVLRRFIHYSEERSRQAGVTPQQYQLLLAVHGQAGRDWATINELAEALQIQHHAAVGLVSRCERAKLVRREPDETDRRQVHVVMREKGTALTEQVARQNFGELKDLLLTLELLFQNGVVTMTQAAAVVETVSLDRRKSEKSAGPPVKALSAS